MAQLNCILEIVVPGRVLVKENIFIHYVGVIYAIVKRDATDASD